MYKTFVKIFFIGLLIIVSYVIYILIDTKNLEVLSKKLFGIQDDLLLNTLNRLQLHSKFKQTKGLLDII